MQITVTFSNHEDLKQGIEALDLESPNGTLGQSEFDLTSIDNTMQINGIDVEGVETVKRVLQDYAEEELIAEPFELQVA